MPWLISDFDFDRIENLLLVMQEVMRHVIANVSEDATAIHSYSGIPVVEEHSVSQLPKWGG